MASKRTGLNNSDMANAVKRPAANLADSVFGGTSPITRVEEQKAEEAKELTKREKEALAREEKKKREALEKEVAKKYLSFKEIARKTFLFDPITVEALRIFCFKHNKKLSEAVLDMFLKYIPREIWVEARNNIIDIEETPADYLDDVKKLDIDSIYYHKRKIAEE